MCSSKVNLTILWISIYSAKDSYLKTWEKATKEHNGSVRSRRAGDVYTGLPRGRLVPYPAAVTRYTHTHTHTHPPRVQTLTSNRWTAPSCSFFASTWACETQGAAFQFTFIYIAVTFQVKTPMKGLCRQNRNTFSITCDLGENGCKESHRLCQRVKRRRWRMPLTSTSYFLLTFNTWKQPWFRQFLLTHNQLFIL